MYVPLSKSAFMSNLELQEKLGSFGLLDPIYDGLWGVESALAFRMYKEIAGLTDASSDAVAESILKGKDPIPLKLGDNLASNIVRAALDEGFHLAKGNGLYNLFYGEEMNADGSLRKEEPDAFNDRAFIVEIKNDGIPKIIGNYTATTEPGIYWTTSGERHPQGAARIALEQFKAWGVGYHKGKYEALVQVADVIVLRDKNQDYSRVGDLEYEGRFGINQHHGGNARKIGRYSAGCPVIQAISSHEQRMAIVKSDRRYKNKKGYVFMTGFMTGQTILKKRASFNLR